MILFYPCIALLSTPSFSNAFPTGKGTDNANGIGITTGNDSFGLDSLGLGVTSAQYTDFTNQYLDETFIKIIEKVTTARTYDEFIGDEQVSSETEGYDDSGSGDFNSSVAKSSSIKEYDTTVDQAEFSPSHGTVPPTVAPQDQTTADQGGLEYLWKKVSVGIGAIIAMSGSFYVACKFKQGVCSKSETESRMEDAPREDSVFYSVIIPQLENDMELVGDIESVQSVEARTYE